MYPGFHPDQFGIRCPFFSQCVPVYDLLGLTYSIDFISFSVSVFHLATNGSLSPHPLPLKHKFPIFQSQPLHFYKTSILTYRFTYVKYYYYVFLPISFFLDPGLVSTNGKDT